MEKLTSKITNWRESDTVILTKWLLLPLVILIAWMSAQLFWKIGSLYNTEQISTSIQSSQNQNSALKSKNDISNLLNQHLFGVSSKATVQVKEVDIIEDDAPETRLNLKLRGIYASTKDERSNAIIENASGVQDLYFLKDPIHGERNLSLAKVFVDRIILKRNGKFETLTMEDLSQELKVKGKENKEKPKAARVKEKNNKRLIDRRNNQQLTKQLAKIKQSMVNDPASLAGLMNVTPKTVNGIFKGFAVSPGKDAALFARSGLRRNDVINSVNGIILDEPSKALTLIDEIRNASELSIELTRGGKPFSLIYNLNDSKQ